jgi:hypothetical protein
VLLCDPVVRLSLTPLVVMSSMYRALKCRDGLYHACIITRSGGQISGYPLGPHRHDLGWTPASMLSHFCTFPGMRYAIRKNIIKIKIRYISSPLSNIFAHSTADRGAGDVMSKVSTSACKSFCVNNHTQRSAKDFLEFSRNIILCLQQGAVCMGVESNQLPGSM